MSRTLSREEKNILLLWTALQVADKQQEKRGLQFGKAMYEYRETHHAQGSRNDLTSPQVEGSGFSALLLRLKIPETSAYRWIAKYETEIGKRPVTPPITPPIITSPLATTIEPDPEPAPVSKAPMSIEERDNQQLRDFTHRLESVTSAMKTLIANDASECSEYPNMVKAAQALAKVIKTL